MNVIPNRLESVRDLTILYSRTAISRNVLADAIKTKSVVKSLATEIARDDMFYKICGILLNCIVPYILRTISNTFINVR